MGESEFPPVERPVLYRLCLVIGHVYDPAAMEYTDHYNCLRCGRTSWYDNGLICWLREFFWRWRQRLWRTPKHRVRTWLKCPDCKCRFGRHDYTIDDHCPF